MKTALMLTAILISISAIGAEETTASEKQIAQLEFDLGQAMIQRDISTLSKLVADEWTIQQDSDQLGTKAGFINDIQSRKLVVTRFNIHDLRIRVLGTVAVVQAFDDEDSFYDGKDGSGTYSWLDVWVQRQGQWVSIATQLTKVRQKH